MFQDFLLFSVQLTISISPQQFHLVTRLRLTHFTHILTSMRKPESSNKISTNSKGQLSHNYITATAEFFFTYRRVALNLDFHLQKKKIMTGSAIQNNTINGGSRGLEVCLRSIPTEPFKNSQPTFLFPFHFSDQR